MLALISINVQNKPCMVLDCFSCYLKVMPELIEPEQESLLLSTRYESAASLRTTLWYDSSYKSSIPNMDTGCHLCRKGGFGMGSASNAAAQSIHSSVLHSCSWADGKHFKPKLQQMMGKKDSQLLELTRSWFLVLLFICRWRHRQRCIVSVNILNKFVWIGLAI